MKRFLLVGLLFGSTAFANEMKDYKYFCEHPQESAGATHTVNKIRARMVYDHQWNMNVSCAEQFAKIQTVSNIWIDGSNDVSDLRPFSNLPNLKYLAIPKNKVRDLSPLTSSPNIESLTLWRNEISDLTPLVSLQKLKTLSLHENKITDAMALAQIPSLESVSLMGNQLASADFIKNLPNLLSLNLSFTGIQQVPDLSHLQKLQNLNLSFNRLSSVPGVSQLRSLRGLNVDENKGITSLESLSQLSGLRDLSADGCSLTAIPELPKDLDFSTVGGLSLMLSNNKISDISAIQGRLYPFTKLRLANNRISDLSAFKAVRGSTEIDLSSNQIKDLSPLSNLFCRDLDVSNNQIQTLDNFIPDPYIGRLIISKNQIQSLAPLASVLPKIRDLNVSHNPLVDVEMVNLMTTQYIHFLSLAGIGLKDLSFINSELLKSVNGIDVSNNDLTDITPLMNLYVPEFIYIGCNPNLSKEQISALEAEYNKGGSQIVFNRCN